MPRKTNESTSQAVASQNGRGGKPSTLQSPPEDPGTALAQAVAVRDALREAAGKANNLIQTL